MKNLDEIYPNTSVNLEYVKLKYNISINSDIKVREFFINVKNKQYSAFLLYIEGMIDSDSINRFVIEPLMLKNASNTSKANPDIVSTAVTNNVSVRRVKKFNLQDYIMDCLVPQNDVSLSKDFNEIFDKVNSGVSALFVDTISLAFLIDAKGFEKRSISSPESEIVVRGSGEGFIESIRTNTTLLRRIINNEDFIIEETKIGNISRTRVAICYLKNVANENIVSMVKEKIDNLDINYLISSGQLEQLLEDSSLSLPQMISSQRPDKVASYILEGRIAILINRNSFFPSSSCCFYRLFNFS